MTSVSTDYHDYVFEDGRLIGDFEEMYRNSAEVPWRQDRTAHEMSADIDMAILRKRSYRSICDVGCGLGFFSARLRQELAMPDGGPPRVVGIDVSPTAVARAAGRFAGIHFVEGDLLGDAWLPPGDGFDLIVIRDVLWYVCHHLNKFLDRVAAMARDAEERGWLLVSQSFPDAQQWVGQDIIGSHDVLVSCLKRHVDVEYVCSEQDVRWQGGSASHVFGRIR